MTGGRLVRYASVLLVLGLFVATGLPAFAQTITGDITGEVTDHTGAVLPNATVTALNTGTNLSRSATTSDNGNYRIPNLAIGEYKVTAIAQGFKTAVSTAEVRAGAIAQASFKMEVGQRAETVEVEGQAPMVETSPNENNYVDSEKIENVPINGRDFNSLLAITPGVQRDPGGAFLPSASTAHAPPPTTISSMASTTMTAITATRRLTKPAFWASRHVVSPRSH